MPEFQLPAARYYFAGVSRARFGRPLGTLELFLGRTELGSEYPFARELIFAGWFLLIADRAGAFSADAISAIPSAAEVGAARNTILEEESFSASRSELPRRAFPFSRDRGAAIRYRLIDAE